MSFDLDAWFAKQYKNFPLSIETIDIASILPDDTREWLITNGLGSFASASISGANTRRYHGLLVAALEPPINRTLLFSRIDEKVNDIDLATNIWTDNVVSPLGYKNLVTFSSFPIPTWVFDIKTGFLIKQIIMPKGKQQTLIGYSYIADESNPAIDLSLHLLLNDRDFHSETKACDLPFHQVLSKNSLAINFSETNHQIFFSFPNASFSPEPLWYYNYYWPREYERGLNASEDLFHIGRLQTQLSPNSSFTLSACASNNLPFLSIEQTIQNNIDSWNDMLAKSSPLSINAWAKSLLISSDSFIVERKIQKYKEVKSHTVMAGYHWFNDWGRDTMISLPGLALATKRFDVTKNIIETFAHYLSEGMLPNNFPDNTNTPTYNNADAVFWWALAIYYYYQASNDIVFVKNHLDNLDSVYEWHLSSTRYGIHIDPDDGLLSTANENVQLTWMDAKVGDFVVTPRTGKAVEINALWFNFLCILDYFYKLANKENVVLKKQIEKTKKSFNDIFWNQNRNCLYDVINLDKSPDASIRPNQLFALSLPFELLEKERAKSVLTVVEDELLTPFGLRTLSPHDKNYHGQYGDGLSSANQYARDITYHQGTVWPWLIGAWADARYKVYGTNNENMEVLSKYIIPLKKHMFSDSGIGFISEIFDGDPPHLPHGCIAQAWSQAELLRILYQHKNILERL